MATIILSELERLAATALEHAGASPEAAAITAQALVYADAQGLASHGSSRVPQYAAHIRNQRVDGRATPRILRERGGACLVDAADGLALPACRLAVEEAIRRATVHGVAFCGVTNSHHFGPAGYHLEPVGREGMLGRAFTTSPGAMLALMVELMCCALTGAHFGFEADSFFTETGNRSRIGHAFIVIDPRALAGENVFFERIETLIAAMQLDPEVRLPGYRRYGLANEAGA